MRTYIIEGTSSSWLHRKRKRYLNVVVNQQNSTWSYGIWDYKKYAARFNCMKKAKEAMDKYVSPSYKPRIVCISSK